MENCYLYYVVDSWLSDEKCAFKYLDKNYLSHESFDSANDALNDKISDYRYNRDDLKIVKVAKVK